MQDDPLYQWYGSQIKLREAELSKIQNNRQYTAERIAITRELQFLRRDRLRLLDDPQNSPSDYGMF